MPFGLCNAPATFEHLMESVHGGLSYEAYLIYLDDIIIAGRFFQEQLKNIRRVLQKLKVTNRKLSPSKCHLFRREGTYLGHIITTECVRTDPDKISPVKDWNCPTDVHQLRSFWGLCTICLSKPERKELLAVIKAVEHFHAYLYGRRFLQRTEHASLIWLLNFKNAKGPIARGTQRLLEYDVEIHHRKESAHGNADAFSRIPCPESCKCCSRIEKKFVIIGPIFRQATSPSTSALDPWSNESIQKDQLADPEKTDHRIQRVI
ncbi:retrovirus-related Pol polyprotein from transposon 17.6 [Trichonephila clavipes]|nr:retrovirus-related Pol polyprotein from transposon 17.6 [Trichonephila clavipes]